MHGHADGAGLVGDCAGDCLADPPGGIRGKLVSAPPIKFVGAAHQANVAFLDQVQELQAAIGIFLGDGDHQAQICRGQFAFGLLRFGLAPVNQDKRALQRAGPHFTRLFNLAYPAAAGTQFLASFQRRVAMGCLHAPLQAGRLAFQELQPLNRVAEQFNQPLALALFEFNGTRE